MKRDDLIQFLNNGLKPHLYQDLCPNGLQIEGKETIKKVAFAVSATAESIKQSIDWGADTLITHHGVFWKYQSGRPIVGSWGKRLKDLIRNDINLISYHLPLDGHIEWGNAAQIAKKLELVDIEPFGEYKKSFIGAKGTFPTPLSVIELSAKLEMILSHKIIISTDDEDKKIKSIGIITGGANNDWVQAAQAGLDAYLTGEISEYNWHDAKEEGMTYFAGGHHATEKFGVQVLKEEIEKNFGVETIFFDSSNPA